MEICISFAFIVLLGSLPATFDLTDADEDDKHDHFNDDADQRPDRSQTVYNNSSGFNRAGPANLQISLSGYLKTPDTPQIP